MRQLDLDLRARVIPFPLARQTQLVHALAVAYDQLPENEARAYWDAEMNRLGHQLLGQGVARADAEREVRSLSRAVSLELDRLDWSQTRPGGA